MLMWGQGPRGPGEVCGVDVGSGYPGVRVLGDQGRSVVLMWGSGSPGTRGGLWC